MVFYHVKKDFSYIYYLRNNKMLITLKWSFFYFFSIEMMRVVLFHATMNGVLQINEERMIATDLP